MTPATGGTGTALPASVSFQAAVPVVLFVAVNRVAGLRWAVLVATAWSVKVIIDRRRQNVPLGRFLPLVTAAVIIRGAIGAATESETIYFGLGIATKYAVCLALFGSILARAPLAARAAPLIMEVPDELATNPLFGSTMNVVTAIGGLYYAVSASFDIWLFRRSSVDGYVVVRFLANWPLSAAALIAILAVVHLRFQRIPGLPPAIELVERRLGRTVDESTTDRSIARSTNGPTGVDDEPETTP